MSSLPETDLDSLRNSLTELKRAAAKAIAGAQLGGDRRRRRDLARELESCKRRARSLSRTVDEFLRAADEGDEVRAELEQASRFLAQLQAMGPASPR